MDFKIGDKVYQHDDTKEYTITAIHDYGYKPLKGAVSIWMIDKNLNNYTTNSNKVFIKRNILKKLWFWIMTKIPFLSPKSKSAENDK